MLSKKKHSFLDLLGMTGVGILMGVLAYRWYQANQTLKTLQGFGR